MTSLPSISVVVCCHNSAARLPETLRHLAEQQTPGKLTKETLLVDNASTDETVSVAERFASWRPSLSISIPSELKLGQTYARLRGVEETSGQMIFFADDDNWLAPECLAIFAETMRRCPEIAALGGMSTAVFRTGAAGVDVPESTLVFLHRRFLEIAAGAGESGSAWRRPCKA